MLNSETVKSKIVPAICTQCSAQIEVDPSRDAAICPHCGTAFIVEKVIKSFVVQNIQHMNVEHIDTVNINTSNSKDSRKQNFLDRHFDRLTRIAIEREKLKVEKAKQMAEERAKALKIVPYALLAMVIILLALIFTMNKLLV